MTPSRIFKKTAAAYEIAKIVGILFWLPLLALAILTAYHSW